MACLARGGKWGARTTLGDVAPEGSEVPPSRSQHPSGTEAHNDSCQDPFPSEVRVTPTLFPGMFQRIRALSQTGKGVSMGK